MENYNERPDQYNHIKYLEIFNIQQVLHKFP